MTASGQKSQPAIGFLSVIEGPDGGLCGGLLLLNPLARPLEFHCTAAVRPSRAQEILYGPTLRPFLFGEQIAQVLFQKCGLAPDWVCTDQIDVLAVRPLVASPLVLIQSAAAASAAISAPAAGDPVPQRSAGLVSFSLGGHTLQVPAAYAADHERVAESWQELSLQIDLTEPFSRVHEALREALRGARAAA